MNIKYVRVIHIGQVTLHYAPISPLRAIEDYYLALNDLIAFAAN